MPSDPGRSFYGQALRSAYREPPYARRSYDDYGGSTLGDLIGRQGQLQAQRHASGADMLARGVQEAGQQIAGYFTEKAEKQEMAKRDAATMAAIESWDGQDPMQLYKGIAKVRGPADSLQYTNTVLSLRKGPQKDPEKELERFGKIAQFMKDQPDDVIARAWPAIRQSIGSTAAQLGLGDAEQWDPKFRPIVAKAGELFGPKQEGRKVGTLSPGAVAFDETTGQIIAHGPEKKEPRRLQTLSPGQTVIDEATGQVVAKAPPAPQAPRDERLVQADVDGVATWVRESQAVGKPAAQTARGATGAERGVLAFYNRGRKALEDIAPLEGKVAKYGFLDQRALAYDGPGENYVKSEEQQQYRQAQRAFTEARLRKESGAAIPKEEYANDARTYFAQPGDTEAVLAQKKAAREEVLQGLGYASGKAYQEYYGAPIETPRNRGGAGATGGPPRVSSDADYAKLPSGATYIGPDGKTRRKR